MLLDQNNVLTLDEPTNHLDLESIEALNYALGLFEGTVIFVSHDREFVSSLATRVIEVTPNQINDFRGTYEEFLARCTNCWWARTLGFLTIDILDSYSRYRMPMVRFKIQMFIGFSLQNSMKGRKKTGSIVKTSLI
jgi:energy-coupling factor transporter ATP-binding protein EcfA2